MSDPTEAASTTIYVDADACPVRDEIYRVAHRFSLPVVLVTNGSRPIRPTGLAFVRMVLVEEGADRADDWIAERIGPRDLCVTSDIPLAARCLAAGARALAANGTVWSDDNIGERLAGRAISAHLREMGLATRGPPPFSKQHRSAFLNALDAELTALRRQAGPRSSPPPDAPRE